LEDSWQSAGASRSWAEETSTSTARVSYSRLFLSRTTVHTATARLSRKPSARSPLAQANSSSRIFASSSVTPNNSLQLPRSARCARRETDRGQSLRAALVAEAGCYPVATALRRLQHASLVLVATLSLGSCGSADLCANKVTSWIPSPDGSRVLVVFVRGCGATTRCSTQASLLSKDEEFLPEPTAWASTKGGNALVVDDGDWRSPSPVEARWTSARELVLIHQARARVILQESSVLGVSIEHRGAGR
jgi:hypothetical protein